MTDGEEIISDDIETAEPSVPAQPADEGMGVVAATPKWLTLTGIVVGFLMIAVGIALRFVAPNDGIVWQLGFCTGVALIFAALGTRGNAQWRGFTVTGAGAIAVILFLLLMKFGKEPELATARINFYSEYPKFVELVGLESAGTPLPGAWVSVKKNYFFRILESDIEDDTCVSFAVTADFNNNGKIEDQEEYTVELHQRHFKHAFAKGRTARFWFDPRAPAIYKNKDDFNGNKPPISSGSCFEPTTAPSETSWYHAAGRLFAALTHNGRLIGRAFAADPRAPVPKEIVGDLQSRSSSVRRQTRAQLAKAGPPAVGVLVDAYKAQPDIYRVKLGVVNSLGQMLSFKAARPSELNAKIPPETLKSFATLIDDPDKTMRRNATSLLVRLDNAALVPTLLKVIRKPKSNEGEYNAALLVSRLWPSLDLTAREMVKTSLVPVADNLGKESLGVLSEILAEQGSLASNPDGWAFVGLFLGKSWDGKQHNFEGRTIPSAGDTLTATKKTKNHVGPVRYDAKLGWVNQQSTGIIKPGQQIEVLEVRNIADGLIWVRFSATGRAAPPDKKIFHVVIGSFSKRSNAVNLAERMRAKGYESVIYRNTTGFYAVTAGEAERAGAEALRDKLTTEQAPMYGAYLHDGSRFRSKVEYGN